MPCPTVIRGASYSNWWADSETKSQILGGAQEGKPTEEGSRRIVGVIGADYH